MKSGKYLLSAPPIPGLLAGLFFLLKENLLKYPIERSERPRNQLLLLLRFREHRFHVLAWPWLFFWRAKEDKALIASEGELLGPYHLVCRRGSKLDAENARFIDSRIFFSSLTYCVFRVPMKERKLYIVYVVIMFFMCF